MTVLAAPARAALRLLDGPEDTLGAESFDAHVARLGTRPRGGAGVLAKLETSGLCGRGGAGFPTWRKWTSVVSNARGDAVVVANASEGEPWSAKDRTLLSLRPHLVLDGTAIAAETVGAREVVVYVGAPFRTARRALRHALRERRRAHVDSIAVHVVVAPHRYVAGEESALVRRVEGGPARPRSVPPRPFERGVFGRPTLVQNAETLAHAALIARYGAGWFRSMGTETSPGTALLTVDGAVTHPGVVEVPLGITVGEVAGLRGGVTAPVQAVLLGGYFGTWIPGPAARDLCLDASSLRAADGASLGCGVVALLPDAGCGVMETARIATYLASESAGQCGPCVHGLAAIASALAALARGTASPDTLALLDRWTGQVRGRGGCRHPDGAVRHVLSALRTFAADVDRHAHGIPCAGAARPSPMPPVPGVDRLP